MNHTFPEIGSLCLTPEKGSPLYMKRTIDSNVTIYVDRFPLFPSFGLHNEMLQ